MTTAATAEINLDVKEATTEAVTKVAGTVVIRGTKDRLGEMIGGEVEMNTTMRGEDTVTLVVGETGVHLQQNEWEKTGTWTFF